MSGTTHAQGRSLKPGDNVRVEFGTSVVNGTILDRASRDYLRVALNIDGADEPVETLIHKGQIVETQDC